LEQSAAAAASAFTLREVQGTATTAMATSSANSDATAKEQGTIVGNMPKTPIHDDTTDTLNEKEDGSPSRTLEADGDEDEAFVDDSKEMQRRASVVQALARSYSRASGVTGDNPFLAGADSPLNPASENFSGKEWAKAIVELVSQDGGSFRSAGVCFQNLNVHGFGESTDYQKDVANVWFSLAGWIGSLVSSNKQRIDILRQFDGIVRKGEMLVVLGPPGSGCSTFLKTIAGEMNGIYVDDDAYFNYQGKFLNIPPIT
jgi:ABC-type glutathione transport system ATPase component